ncbi:hypothetical protein AB836_00630 [Rickettsiales bacterium (ex Bugula neritina AB1)]|nr:hypothetical protein AB836_00630 [Rickettsiales bacterium (ex Bugula neritina AB1)]
MDIMCFVPLLLSNLFFQLANKCLPIFVSIFLLDKGLTKFQILFIYIFFHLGSLTKSYVYKSSKDSLRNLLISINILIIVCVLEYRVFRDILLFLIVFIQGICDIISKNSFQNMIYSVSHNNKDTAFFGRVVSFFYSCTGVIISLIVYIFQSTSVTISIGVVAFAISNIMLLMQNTKAFVYRNFQYHNKSINIFYIYRYNFIGALLLFLVSFFTNSFLQILPIILKQKYFIRSYIFRIVFFTNLGILLAHFVYIRFNGVFYKTIKKLCLCLIFLYINAMFVLTTKYKVLLEVITLLIGFIHTILSIDIRNILQKELEAEGQEVLIGYNQILHVAAIISLIFSFLFSQYLQYGFFLFYTCIIILILFLYSFKEYLHRQIYE